MIPRERHPVAHAALVCIEVAGAIGWAIFVLLVSCTPVPPHPTPALAPTAPNLLVAPTTPYPDDEPTATDPCIRAARKLWALGCTGNVRHVNGEAFAPFCRERPQLIASECIAAAQSVDALPACRVTCHPAAP